jgi:hypothetical protein
MPAPIDSLRFPYERVLLQRTKLAYVHLPHLLTDAKRDRAARVFGYVGIWIADDVILLYLQEGEVVNATRSEPGRSKAIPVGEALAMVPPEPEFGEICFHECADEQLACMFQSLTAPPEPWPEELDATDGNALFAYLMSTTYDGTVEVTAGTIVNYLVVRDGQVERAFVYGRPDITPPEAIDRLFPAHRTAAPPVVRRWGVAPPVPAQASPALIKAYRELAPTLVQRLVSSGNQSAPQIAEQARQRLLPAHPVLDHFTIGERPMRDPVAEADAVTAGIAAWLAEMMWAGMDQGERSPEDLLREITRDRRHMFQSAGFFDRLPWMVEW